MASIWAELVERAFGLVVLLTSLEYINARYLLASDGLLSWDVHRLSRALYVKGHLGRVLTFAFAYPRVVGLVIIRAGLGLLVIISPNVITLLMTTLVVLVFLARSRYGLDGADQLTLFVLGASTICSLLVWDREEAARLFLIVLGVQICLCYLASGVAKFRSGRWRSGEALALITATSMYGSPNISMLLKRFPQVGRVLTWGTIAWEVCFPLVLLVPQTEALAIIVTGVLFHIGIAVVLGLNDFLLAFTATYPAVWFTRLAITG